MAPNRLDVIPKSDFHYGDFQNLTLEDSVLTELRFFSANKMHEFSTGVQREFVTSIIGLVLKKLEEQISDN